MNRIAQQSPEPDEEPKETLSDIVPTHDLMSQVQIARAFPRQIARFTSKATAMATADQETAEGCFYVLKRKSKKTGEEKKIQGPSIRLAEICTQCYGNLRWGGRTVGEEERAIVVQGVAHDLESNVFCQVEVRRRITTSGGYRYNDDMITVASMAGIAICMRNAALKVIPTYLWKPVYDAAVAKAVGDASTLADRRQRMVAAYAKMGVGIEKILAFCSRKALEEITLEDLTDLIGAFNSIRDGEQTVDEVFNPKPDQPEGPRTVAEAAAQGSPAAPAVTNPVTGAQEADAPSAGDTPSPEEQAAIRAAEQAEARAGQARPDLIPVLDVLTQPRPPVANQASQDAPGSPIAGEKVVTGAQKNRERLWTVLKKVGKGSMGGVAKLAELTGGKATSVAYLSDEEVATLLNTLSKGGAANA